MASADQLIEVLRQVDDPLALLTGILAHSPLAIHVLRVDGTSLLVNPAFENIFGAVPPAEYNVFRDEVVERLGLRDRIARAFAGEVVRTAAFWYDPRELRHIDVPTANRVALEATFFPLRDARGDIEHVAIVFKDVTTERRLLEVAERERDRYAFHATVLENVDDSIIVTDNDGRIIQWNEGARRIFGYSADEMLGRTPAVLYPNADAERFEGELSHIDAGSDFVGAWQGRRKDGATVWVEIKTTRLLDAQGNVVGFVGVGKDVTDRLRAERERERASAEREAALVAAESASRAKDEFLAMLGHELRNPLSPIVTALQLLHLKGAARTREHDVIKRQVEHLVRLVDDLLDVSRITRGVVELKKEPIDLGDAIARSVEMSSPLLEQKRHSLTVDVPRIGTRLEGDAARLSQVFSNLITNAAKYTPPGGHIALRAWREADDIVVSIQDDGIGMDRDLLPHVFDLFVQGRRGSDRAQGGLGLGLTLVRNLVSLHGGTVQAKSAGLGEGSELIVRLPALSEGTPTRALRGTTRAVERALQPRRVLVVDDNVDSAELIGDLLRSAGHDVAVAHDGPGALATFDAFEPDVALLDIGLPVMDGYELARRLRELSRGRPMSFVAVTGYGQEYDRTRSVEAGFAEHLVKPVAPNLLLATVAAQPQ